MNKINYTCSQLVADLCDTPLPPRSNLTPLQVLLQVADYFEVGADNLRHPGPGDPPQHAQPIAILFCFALTDASAEHIAQTFKFTDPEVAKSVIEALAMFAVREGLENDIWALEILNILEQIYPEYEAATDACSPSP